MKSSANSSYTISGMPKLKKQSNTVSHFEFWPTWAIYLPVAFQWIGLSIRHRSLSLPLIANPSVPLSGMVGFSKSDVMAAAGRVAQENILPFVVHLSQGSVESQLSEIEKRLEEHGLSIPLVAKPDMGCRGAGVCLIKTKAELKEYIETYPEGGSVMLQKLSNWEPEAGIFYIKEPESDRGKIISLALKYIPYVVGDGQHTLRDLIAKDERAGPLMHLYAERHKEMMDQIIPEGEPYSLVFSVSHCRGAVFRDGNEYITQALTDKLDRFFNDIPNFYYGRLDVKFKNVESLIEGETLEIVEINGASSESLDIWDSDTTLSKAWSTLLHQYGMLFKIGAQNRKLGHRTPGLLSLWKAWKIERDLVRQYPETS